MSFEQLGEKNRFLVLFWWGMAKQVKTYNKGYKGS